MIFNHTRTQTTFYTSVCGTGIANIKLPATLPPFDLTPDEMWDQFIRRIMKEPPPSFDLTPDEAWDLFIRSITKDVIAKYGDPVGPSDDKIK